MDEIWRHEVLLICESSSQRVKVSGEQTDHLDQPASFTKATNSSEIKNVLLMFAEKPASPHASAFI